MSTKPNRFNSSALALLTVFFVIAVAAYPINGLKSRELDENTAPSGDQGIKCTPSCTQSPPPPPACPPPPSPKKPPRHCCPAAPTPPSVIYTTGPPGGLYPIDQNFGGATRNLEVGLLALVSGFMVLLAF
ncbi:hypothetical protein like AT1G23040 [Hibiscus trionum]|uniref:Uncharacterized protein n=1 Tax=Hibiscus trionum TaxID=183268 RepID=A0A9W7MDG4_HIBTR|nr:hypothetical protein like AT1G23040 [Hibiscus trionum]